VRQLTTTRGSGTAERLLVWYDRHRRVLPWRAQPGETAEPYRVWLSEIMLQQTTVQAVAGYYRKFLKRWPTVETLADAKLDEVLAAWAGLGYYARARNLHKAAQAVAARGGRFPQTAEGLRELPGVGAYTAGAIAAIAFGASEVAMDANAERVIARLYAVKEPLPGAKAKLTKLCRSLLPERSGDFVQALMDLGATLCTAKRPACARCPWMTACKARKLGLQETLPLKAPKAARPLKRGAAFVARDAAGAVLLEKRPEKGLLGSMLQPPLGVWGEEFPSRAEALKQAPFRAAWKKLPGVVRHGFTHFELEVEVWFVEVKQHCHPRPSSRSKAKAGRGRGSRSSLREKAEEFAPGFSVESGNAQPPGSPSLGAQERASPGMTKGGWVGTSNLHAVALPTVMRKIIAHAMTDD
jgi:A/G-specific adenine glycosylase